MKEAIELKPDFIDPYFNISITYLEIGDKTAAFYYLNICPEKYANQLSVNELQRLQRLIAEAKKFEWLALIHRGNFHTFSQDN